MRQRVIVGVSLSLLAAICMAVLIMASTGDERVVEAAMKGDRDTVRALLKQAADVNAAQGDGMTALHWAALKGDTEMAEMLLYAGANIKAATRLGGYTPLYFAAKSGNTKVIEVLLKNGADAKAAVPLGITPLMMAASSGQPDAVKLLLDHGADPNAVETEHGQTALGFAAAFDRPEVIKVLVAQGAKVDQASKVIPPPPPPQRGFGQFGGQGGGRGAQGQTAQAQGAQAQGGQAKEPQGQGAAPAAGRGGHGAQPSPPAEVASNATNNASNSAPNNTANNTAQPARGQGQQAQQGQQQQGQKQGMNGADAGSRGGGNDKGGLTPLMYAARQGHMQAATALLDSGANINEVSADKTTALVFAIINAHFDLAKMLIERGGDVNRPSVDGAAPLYVVANTQWARHSFYPQPTPKYEKTSYLALMKLLLDKGANPNARLGKDLWYSEYNFSLESASAAGTTAFWKCAEVGDIDGMKLLVSRGADPNLASNDEVTPLLMASGAGVHGNDDVTAPPGRMAAVKYLVEGLHADVNAADKGNNQRGFGGGNLQQFAIRLATDQNNGQPPTEKQIADALEDIQRQAAQSGFGGKGGGVTALHNAAARGDNEMILYLVAHGAKVDAVANNGATVVDLANGPRQRIQPYPETIALLEMLGAKNSHKCVSC